MARDIPKGVRQLLRGSAGRPQAQEAPHCPQDKTPRAPARPAGTVLHPHCATQCEWDLRGGYPDTRAGFESRGAFVREPLAPSTRLEQERCYGRRVCR